MVKEFIGPSIRTRKYNEFGSHLNIELNDAKNRRNRRGYTKNLYEFLKKAEDKENLVGFKEKLLPMVAGHDVYVSGFRESGDYSNIITSTDMSCMINYHIIKDKFKENYNLDGFYNEYFPFITSCRKVARNVIKQNSVRIPFDSNRLKKDVKTYENFLEFLKKNADNLDDKHRSFINFIW